MIPLLAQAADASSPLWSLSLPWWHFFLRATVVYFAILLLLRLSGKRQVAQMGVTELVALLLISNAVQNSMNGGDNSITGGMILSGTLIALSTGMALATYRSRRLESWIQGRPTILIHKGQLVTEHLKSELLTIRELRAMLRRQGIQDFGEVEEAILESDGFVSVIRKSEISEMERMRLEEVY